MVVSHGFKLDGIGKWKVMYRKKAEWKVTWKCCRKIVHLRFININITTPTSPSCLANPSTTTPRLMLPSISNFQIHHHIHHSPLQQNAINNKHDVVTVTTANLKPISEAKTRDEKREQFGRIEQTTIHSDSHRHCVLVRPLLHPRNPPRLQNRPKTTTHSHPPSTRSPPKRRRLRLDPKRRRVRFGALPILLPRRKSHLGRTKTKITEPARPHF